MCARRPIICSSCGQAAHHPHKLPPLANFAQRIYGYVDKAYIPPEEIQRMEARIRPYVK